MEFIKSSDIPKHIVIIMDGNGRWAKQRKLPRLAGHKQGLDATRAIVRAAAKMGIEYLSLFAFSSENWSRPETEVSGLLELFKFALSREMADLHKADIRVQFIGDRSRFSAKLQQLMQDAEQKTASNKKMTLILAVNYGGRWDIQQASQQLVADCIRSGCSVESAKEKDIAAYLALAQFPDPDLFIRTSGEQRISNYFLWQLAYTELYFTECFWPDFREPELQHAIEWYASRQRRFGMISEQLEPEA